MREIDRSRYTQEAESRYEEMAGRLAGITTKLLLNTIEDVTDIDGHVGKIIEQSETQLAAVRLRLSNLKAADDLSWQHHKRDLETGWEDLLRSIKSLVTRVL